MKLRYDFQLISEWVDKNARVLDLGCGDGELLAYLAAERGVSGYGIENDSENLTRSIARGINVLQMNLESGLAEFNDQQFDYVILSLTLQAMKRTEQTMREMVRVGREAIVTFPNFGYWQHRVDLFRGRMPKSEELPYEWYNTPNIHLCTIADFEDFCGKLNVKIEDRVIMNEGRRIKTLPNLRGSIAIYRLRRGR